MRRWKEIKRQSMPKRARAERLNFDNTLRQATASAENEAMMESDNEDSEKEEEGEEEEVLEVVVQ